MKINEWEKWDIEGDNQLKILGSERIKQILKKNLYNLHSHRIWRKYVE